MPEASTRVLLDRTTIRLDGRPFFAFGTRLFLTSAEDVPEAMRELADLGFTCVTTPPASPGILPVLNAIFDAADRHGLLVVLEAEPRFPEPGAFLAEHFRQRRSLHSYCLPTRDDSEESFMWFCRERDRLRTQDLFHPIWTPLRPGFPLRLWINSVDIHSAAHACGGPIPRLPETTGHERLNEVFEECARLRIPGRPLFCHSFEARVPDEAREQGLYQFDPVARQSSPRARDWHPYLSTLGTMARWDFLPPDPDLLRLRTFELLAARVRGIMVDFHEFLGGPPPLTGRDRLLELSCLAREIRVLNEFFAEGQFVRADVETGHPALRATMLHHSDDILLLLWRSAPGDEYWIDPTRMARVEVNIGIEAPDDITAWRMDFPSATPVPISRDAKNAIRLHLESIDLTAKVLLTRSRQRPQDVANVLAGQLPRAAGDRVACLDLRLAKIAFVEGELAARDHGLRHHQQLEECRQLLVEARHLLEIEAWADSWQMGSLACQVLRTIINRQMIRAMASSLDAGREKTTDMLRRSYYTLPAYYRELTLHDSELVQEYT